MDNKVYLAARNLRNGAYTLYAEYSHDRKVKRIATGVSVPQSQWDNKTRTMTGAGATAANNKARRVLDTLRTEIRDLYAANGNVYPTIKQLNQRREQSSLVLKAAAAEQPLVTVLATWMETKHDWAKSTRNNFQTVLNNIVDFQRAKRTTWFLSSLQSDDIAEWQIWMKTATQGKEQVGYADSTSHKRVRLLRQFLRRNPAPHVDLSSDESKALHAVMLVTPFVLSPENLDSIEAMNLPEASLLDRVRDLLLLQAFTGLRWSDLSRLESRFVKKDFIEIRMKKSGAKGAIVHIPIFDQARRVLDKYTSSDGLQLPQLYEQQFNDSLKRLCALLPELNENYTQEYRLRGVDMERTKRKWRFVTSHTLRRTFISMCLDMNYPPKEVMSWSGHTSWASFQRYIGASQQRKEAAADFARRWNQQRTAATTYSEYAGSMQPQRKRTERNSLQPAKSSTKAYSGAL